ncbi:hypothetical protein IFM89_032840 [Coptis chinensis]|uniref:Uncharacterized protein n=1 Tax=Coptis chinensis TaxID=261450 RepID=A0A835IHY2_9MAGN|nr:hypothetical protein IFM89_032840 [Coptis chinensis]
MVIVLNSSPSCILQMNCKGTGLGEDSYEVFKALRIAVNDELNTLEHALSLLVLTAFLLEVYRLAVISFHNLVDRIVKKMFVDLVNVSDGDVGEELTRVLQLDTDGSLTLGEMLRMGLFSQSGL